MRMPLTVTLIGIAFLSTGCSASRSALTSDTKDTKTKGAYQRREVDSNPDFNDDLPSGTATVQSANRTNHAESTVLSRTDSVVETTSATDSAGRGIVNADFEQSEIELTSLSDDSPKRTISNPLDQEISDAQAIPYPTQGIPVPPGDLPLPLTESAKQQSVNHPKAPIAVESEDDSDIIRLDDVISSIYASYPLVASAVQQRRIAEGQQLSAAGAYDLKLKASSEAGELGYYQTYRQSVGLVQPTYNGGEVFAGYRIGRGEFQPWYLERQTNDGGEFKVGMAVPLLKNRNIDARRAEIWRSTYERQLVEPEIQAQLIDFILEASVVYWNWVATGQYYLVDARVLKIAEERTNRIKRQVEVGLIDPPQLTDNNRLIATRKAAVAESARKFREGAVKLSLFYRDISGNPVIPSPDVLPNFPDPQLIGIESMQADIELAMIQRPELKTYDLLRRQLDVDLAEASNEYRPSLDFVVAGSQDVGAPTSSKRDKSPFELETGVFADVPVQRRKARGKSLAIEAKLAQLAAKRRLTEDKIVTDVQGAYASLVATYEAVKQTITAVELAEELAERERRNFEKGLSDLLTVTLREQFAAESALKQVEALKQHYQALAKYRAALAQDQAPIEMRSVE